MTVLADVISAEPVMSHLVLLGDSIFDNAPYVPGEPSVIDHLRRLLPAGWQATLLARDGSVTSDVAGQLAGLPGDATHLVVSAGGNDALANALALSPMLHEQPARPAGEALAGLADIREQFRNDYRRMLECVAKQGRPVVVCTVYDSIPGLDRVEETGLCLFNDVILREAFRVRVPVIDLRLVCREATDYAASSPIEPSAAGGGKIARAISRVVTEYDFRAEGSLVFG
jgi:hypothetical protein